MSGVESLTQRIAKGRETLPQGREGLRGHVGGREGLGGPTGGLGGVGRGREAHPESWEGSRGKEEYGRPSQRAVSGQKAFLEGCKGSGEKGGVGRPFQRVKKHWEAHPEGREESRGPPMR